MNWIIGGTKDSRDFINILAEKNADLTDIIVTTASEYGKKLVENENIKVKSGRMDIDEIKNFVIENGIKRIFDLSHPYAIEISKNAMEIAQETGIKYFRFERENLEYKDSINFYDIDEMIIFLEKIDENILVTLGSNNADKFKNMKNLENIYFRVLPVSESIEKMETAGIKAKNIIGLQGPFSKEFNKAMYQNFNIKYVVTKESGKIGGEPEKIEAAYETGVIPVVLKRPEIKYLWVTSDISEIVEKFIDKV